MPPKGGEICRKWQVVLNFRFPEMSIFFTVLAAFVKCLSTLETGHRFWLHSWQVYKSFESPGLDLQLNGL